MISTNSTRKLTRPRKLRTSGKSNTRNDTSTCLHICLRVIFIGAVVISLFSVYLSSVFTTYINGPNHSDTDYHLSFAPLIKSIPKTENNIFAAFQRLMNEYRDDDTTIKVPTASPTTEGPTTYLPTTDAPTGGTTATEVPEATDTDADADTTTKTGTTNSLSSNSDVSTTGKAPEEQPEDATNAPTTLPTSGGTDTAAAVTNTTTTMTSSKMTPQQQPENATIAPTSEDTQDGTNQDSSEGTAKTPSGTTAAANTTTSAASTSQINVPSTIVDVPDESHIASPPVSSTVSIDKRTGRVHVVSGDDAFFRSNDVGGYLCENEYLEILFATYRAVLIEIRNHGWTDTINLPNAASIAGGSVLTIGVASNLPVNVFTPNAGWVLSKDSRETEISFQVIDGAWKQLTGFQLEAGKTACTSDPTKVDVTAASHVSFASNVLSRVGLGLGSTPIVSPNKSHGSPVNDNLRNILAKTRDEFNKREREFRRTSVDNTPQRAPKITTHPPENVWLINESGDLTSATKRRNRPQKRIPKILTKVYIQHSGTLTDPTDMNEGLFRAHRSWKKMNPDVKVQYFDHRSARDYLQKHYHYSFLKTYDCLQPYSYKADFFRMAVVYREGGWYSDWKQECLQPNLMNMISNHGKSDLVLFYGKPRDERLQTAFFGAKQRHDVMARMLARTMKNVYSRSYKGDAWKITGPAALRTAFRGSARMNVANWKEHVIGEFEPDNDMWFFVFNETRVVQHKCNDCNEFEEGNHNWAKGNNYVKMFMRKRVYCPEHRYIFDPPEA